MRHPTAALGCRCYVFATSFQSENVDEGGARGTKRPESDMGQGDLGEDRHHHGGGRGRHRGTSHRGRRDEGVRGALGNSRGTRHRGCDQVNRRAARPPLGPLRAAFVTSIGYSAPDIARPNSQTIGGTYRVLGLAELLHQEGCKTLSLRFGDRYDTPGFVADPDAEAHVMTRDDH
jgi:hypothetical protein